MIRVIGKLPSGEYDVPGECPACGADIQIEPGSDRAGNADGSVVWSCTECDSGGVCESRMEDDE